jgi:carbon-monoxide dehydrogenase small subunit
VSAGGESTLKVNVNGVEREVAADPWARLLDVLREELALTGTKEGCGEGECGACTVLLDGVPVNSCLVAIGQCGGRAVTTVEGLAAGGGAGAGAGAGAPVLNAVQRELVARGGAQCGICTPGIAVCASYLVEHGLADVSKDDARALVRQALAGNICRCTGYQLIVDAVVAAAGGDA